MEVSGVGPGAGSSQRSPTWAAPPCDRQPRGTLPGTASLGAACEAGGYMPELLRLAQGFPASVGRAVWWSFWEGGGRGCRLY